MLRLSAATSEIDANGGDASRAAVMSYLAAGMRVAANHRAAVVSIRSIICFLLFLFVSIVNVIIVLEFRVGARFDCSLCSCQRMASCRSSITSITHHQSTRCNHSQRSTR